MRSIPGTLEVHKSHLYFREDPVASRIEVMTSSLRTRAALIGARAHQGGVGERQDAARHAAARRQRAGRRADQREALCVCSGCRLVAEARARAQGR